MRNHSRLNAKKTLLSLLKSYMISSKKSRLMINLKMDKTMHNKSQTVSLLVSVGASVGLALALSRKLPLILVRSCYA